MSLLKKKVKEFILGIIDFITVTNTPPPTLYFLMESWSVNKKLIFYTPFIFVTLDKYLFDIHFVPDVLYDFCEY